MPNQVFLNTGGRFVNVSEDAGPGKAQPALHRGAVFADFDRDGRIDIAVLLCNQPIELWWTEVPGKQALASTTPEGTRQQLFRDWSGGSLHHRERFAIPLGYQ